MEQEKSRFQIIVLHSQLLRNLHVPLLIQDLVAFFPGKAGIVNVHLGDSPRCLDLIERVVDETEIPASQILPTHINRNEMLFCKSIEYALKGGAVDLREMKILTIGRQSVMRYVYVMVSNVCWMQE